MAYTSDETGRPEVYVREFPFNAESNKWPVSKAGGTNPRWRRDGKELFFAAPDGTVMSVEVAPAATFRAANPKRSSGCLRVFVPIGTLPQTGTFSGADPAGRPGAADGMAELAGRFVRSVGSSTITMSTTRSRLTCRN